MCSEPGQRGVALISILLVVAIATVLATSMTADQNILIHRSRNFFDQQQALAYALGGEELARQILKSDFDDRPERASLDQQWANDELSFEFEQGKVELTIEDLQGRLNVNALSLTGDAGQVTVIRFSTLMRQLGVDPVFLARMEDWMDKDQSTRQLGAEDFDYLALDPPYRSASAIMEDKSELRLLLDMDPETYDKLMPYVCALPDPWTNINVNTASPEVLQALVPGMTLEAAQGLAAARDESGGFDSVEKFLQQPELAGRGVSPQGLGVQSGFFRVSVRARYGDRFAYLTSIIQRDKTDGKMRVVYRDAGRKILPVVKDEKDQTGEQGV